MSIEATVYELVSAATGARRPDEGGWTLHFPDEPYSLLRSEYAVKRLRIRDDLEGLYRYADWLPIRRILSGSASPISYRSKGLAEELGLNNLWITFSGWWPEKGALMSSGTFKECEAYSVCGRMQDGFDKVLVVASAGNTARAFARVCSDNSIPLLLFVPQDNLDALWFHRPISDDVRVICPESGGDYFDAIRMSQVLTAGSRRFIAEGGAANIARRDGMATTVLSAVTAMGRIPDVYFQAVGSGTGAIAAWEAANRLEVDGRFGDNHMRLIVCQNIPFTPMADSLAADSREFLVADDDTARFQAGQARAKVLTNRRPPWGISGGLYDALKATGGSAINATNEESLIAGERFAHSEGIDISDAASVAVASLFKAVQSGAVGKDETVMLNITGGGMKQLREGQQLHMVDKPIVLPLNASDDDILRSSTELFWR